jgi:hypothetical protein
MNPSITIKCSGQDHVIAFDAEGNMIIDPSHDVELETALVALGAEPPRCIEALDSWRLGVFKSDFFTRLLYDAVATFPGEAWTTGQLAVDFAEHALYVFDGDIPEPIELALSTARQIPPYDIAPENPVLTSLFNEVHAIRNHKVQPAAQFLETTAVEQSVYAVNNGHFGFALNAQENAVKAAGYYAVRLKAFTGKPSVDLQDLRAQEAMAEESAWQRKRAVAVLIALFDGKSYPRTPA